MKIKNIKSYDDKIVRYLKFATKIEKKNFNKIISNKKYDVIVFVVDTDYDKTSETHSKYLNKICERFKSLGIKSVLFSFYDLNENGLFIHENVNYVAGDVLFFPAQTKKLTTFNEKLTVQFINLVTKIDQMDREKFRNKNKITRNSSH